MSQNRVAPRLTNLLLAAASCVFCLAALELGVRLLPRDLEFESIPLHDVDPDNRVRYLPNRERTVKTPEFEFTTRYNAWGRRDGEWSEATLADPRNILSIGDSFVFGNNVDDEHSVPTLLEAWLAERGEPREVFNYGRGGAGPWTYRLLLEDALSVGIAARTVAIGEFVGNDFYPGNLLVPIVVGETRRKSAPEPDRFQSEFLRFAKLRLAASPRVVGLALGLSGRLGFSLYDTTGSYIFLRRPTYDQARTFQRILAIFGGIQDLARSHGRKLVIVAFPNRIQVENEDDLTSSFFDAARPNTRILEYCATRDMPCLDLLPVLSERRARDRSPLYFPVDRHLNEAGTRVAAHAIGAFLLEGGALH